MSVPMQQVPSDHPMMIAWKKHQSTDEFKSSKNWAKEHEHLDGSLWALFVAGWNAAHDALDPIHAKEADRLSDLQKVARDVYELIANEMPHKYPEGHKWANLINSDAFRALGNAFISKRITQDITYEKRTGYEVECRNCSYKILFKDEPCGGDGVTCDNCESEYIITR